MEAVESRCPHLYANKEAMLLVSTARNSATPVSLEALAALSFHSTELLINQD
jgi:hypothetical protein